MNVIPTYATFEIDQRINAPSLYKQIRQEPTLECHHRPDRNSLNSGFLQAGHTVELRPMLMAPMHPANPLTIYCKNGVISEQTLQTAEQELGRGYVCILTGDYRWVSQTQATPNETYTNPSDYQTNGVNPAEEWEKRYYQLRSAIRYASLRMQGYKLKDTAEIAEELKDNEDLEEGIESFLALFREIEEQAEIRATRKADEHYKAILAEHQQTEHRLRETIRTAGNILSPEGYFSGGFITGTPATVIPLAASEHVQLARRNGKSEGVTAAVKAMCGIEDKPTEQS